MQDYRITALKLKSENIPDIIFYCMKMWITSLDQRLNLLRMISASMALSFRLNISGTRSGYEFSQVDLLKLLVHLRIRCPEDPFSVG
jgi:hypothetical protein